MSLAHAALKPLPPVADQVDQALIRLDAAINWLFALSPLDSDAMWAAFEASGFRQEPSLAYPPRRRDLETLSKQLLELPVDKIEHSVLRALLHEKQQELSKQVDLITLRDSQGFVAASVALFGAPAPSLLRVAGEVLETVPNPRPPPDQQWADCNEIVQAAHAELSWYRDSVDDLTAQVVVEPDLNSLMMVHLGNFHIAASARVPRASVRAFVAHEIGTHVVTFYNGSKQALRQLSLGLAHYDPLQEGLATLGEYLVGNLSPCRLRVVAARVIATDLAMHGRSVVEIFQLLREQHGLSPEAAFDVAVRAKRGGGLTKDAVYLRGLVEVLDYLAAGGSLHELYLGKFALRQRSSIRQLMDEGWVCDPVLLPRHITSEEGERRIAQVRALSVASLYHQEPVS